MALVHNEYCGKCEVVKPHVNGRCTACQERKRREDMAAWQSLTMEEKLLDVHKRLLRLEQGPPTY